MKNWNDEMIKWETNGNCHYVALEMPNGELLEHDNISKQTLDQFLANDGKYYEVISWV